MANDVMPATEARRDLPKLLKRFRDDPAHAAPVVLGPHRKAEAVLMPIGHYRELLEQLETLTVRAEIADVARRDDGKRGDVAHLARTHGFDPADFGLA